MRRLVALLLCLGFVPAAFADDAATPAEAELSLFVFRDGRPVGDVALELGEAAATTDANGGLLVRVPPGRERLILTEGGSEVLGLDLLTAEGEVLEIIVTLRDGAKPQVLIESSGAGRVDAPPESSAPEPTVEPGLLEGRVRSAETGRPVGGARIFLSGTSISTQTYPDGRYAVEVPPGNYALSVVHADFATQTLDNVRVIPAQAVTADLELAPSGIELAEYVVTAPYIEGSVAAIVELQRSRFSISEVLGAEQMSRSADSDAADALQRVTGITVEGGKYVQVRGLPPRYSTSQLNGSSLPSPDTNRRVVPLDLFPIGVLENLEVSKTYSPDLPGAFGGGLVGLNTKGVPEDGFFKAQVKGEYDTESTLKDGLGYDGGGLDFLGIDDGTRELPGPVDSATAGGSRPIRPRSPTNPDGFTPEELQALGRSFENSWNLDDETNLPNYGVSASGGNRWETDLGDFGFALSGVYKGEWTNQDGVENSIATTGSGGELRYQDQFDELQTEHETTLGGLLTLAGEWGEDHRVTSNTFPMRKTTDTGRIRDGLRAENDQNVREYLLDYVERQLILQQLGGHHRFPVLADLGVDWRGTYALSTRDQPDRREYRYVESRDEYILQQSSNSRRFAEQDEDILGLGLDLSLPLLGEESAFGSTLRAGVQWDDRERDSQVSTYQFVWASGEPPRDISRGDAESVFAPTNIGPDGFVLQDLTGANDDYRGTETILGYYGMVDASWKEVVRVTGGVRLEDAELDVRTFQTAGTGQEEVRSGFDETDILPAATVTWFMPWDDMQLRLAFSETLSRPDLNELSPSSFIDPETLDSFVGNPDLQQSKITNLDLRWEWYLSSTESLTLAVFYKDFTDPIETVRIPGFNAPRSFQNAEAAENFGVEVGFRKNLDFVADWSGSSSSLWKQLYLEGNFAWIDSSVTLASDSDFTNTNTSRALQGQAPYVINLKAGWVSEPLGSDVAVLFNMIGARISEVGVQGLPDVEEQPSPQLDIAWEQKLSDIWAIKLTAENLLFSDTEFKQGGLTQRGYDEGLELGVAVKLSLD